MYYLLKLGKDDGWKSLVIFTKTDDEKIFFINKVIWKQKHSILEEGKAFALYFPEGKSADDFCKSENFDELYERAMLEVL